MFHRGILPHISSLIAFEAAARHGSISRAATELHLTQSAVSRQVLHLERMIGVALFHRLRQRVSLTDAGRVYAVELRQVLLSMSDATQKVMTLAGAGGVLNIAVLPTFGTRWLIPRIPAFAALHPKVTLNFATRSKPFDFAQEPFDCAINFGDPNWAGAVCVPLMNEEVVPICSPHYRDRFDLRAPRDLARAVLLQQTTRPMQWVEWCAGTGTQIPQPLGGPRYEQFAMVAEAAAAGLGVALVPRFLVQRDIRSRRIVIPFLCTLRSKHGYYLAYAKSHGQTALLQAFSEWLVAQARAP